MSAENNRGGTHCFTLLFTCLISIPWSLSLWSLPLRLESKNEELTKEVER